MLQLECCGWEGVKEFAGTSQPIDDSCYERVTPTVSGIVARYSTVQYSWQPTLYFYSEKAIGISATFHLLTPLDWISCDHNCREMTLSGDCHHQSSGET